MSEASVAQGESEAAVVFTEDSVAICGFQAFPRHALDQSDEVISLQKSFSNDDISGADTQMVAAIITVLSKVSKTPSNEITPETTIERIGVDSVSAIKVATLLLEKSLLLEANEIFRLKYLAD